MNRTTRRIVTAIAGTALAASALAATGPAAFAGKPGGGGGSSTTSVSIGGGAHHYTETDTWDYSVDYNVPVAARNIATITCSLDGTPLADCGQSGGTKSTTRYFAVVIGNEAGIVQHQYSFTATTTKGATYAGTVTFAGFDRW